ncbi:MAG: PQQ-like beta-propeller repeat protein [Rhodobacteraceae bacterium]|nr:PQQ-like beta-propeller repeat protein [Paracoccaceae bacterium]
MPLTPQFLGRSFWQRSLCALALLGVLAGCSDPDIILIGAREDVRSGATDDQLPAAPLDRPIRLPAQSVNAEWAAPIGSTRASHAALRAVPQLAWSTRIGEGNSRKNRIATPPIMSGGLIYTMDALSNVTATTPQGAVVWQIDMAKTLDVTGKVSGGGLTYDDGTLYATTGYGALLALDARSGAVRWIQKLGATGSGSPLVRGSLIYVMAGDDRVWALRRDNGRIVWQLEGTPTVANILGGPAPVWTGSLVVFAFSSGEIQATFPQGGLVRWSASVSGQRRGVAVARISSVTGAPVVSGGRIYAGNHSGRIVALDANSGERLWTAAHGAMDPVWPVGGSLFVVSDKNRLLRINAADGQVIWAADLPGFVKERSRRRGGQYANYGPILAGGSIIVASGDGQLRFFDPASGRLKASIEIPGGAASAPIVAGQTLYVLSAKGDLHAFR